MQSVKLDHIVREYILSTGSDSMHKYPLYLQHAIRGIKNIDYDVSGVLKIAELSLSSNYTVTLPNDCIRIVKAGMLRTDGRLTEIYVDNRIVPDPDGTATISDTQGWVLGLNDSISSSFRNGEVIGRQYGNEGGGVFTYNINYSTGTASFSDNVTSPIVLLYLSDPSRVNGEYLVHPFLVEPIMKFIYYADIRFKRSVPRREKEEAERDFLLAKHHANVQFASESLGNLYNASRKTINQSAKW